jgi:hypothetical protein
MRNMPAGQPRKNQAQRLGNERLQVGASLSGDRQNLRPLPWLRDRPHEAPGIWRRR